MKREERFYAKVSKPGCLIWLGARNNWGYGTFAWDHQHNINASRAAWMLKHGEIPQGQDVLHTCNNRQCVNVEHMYLGTDFDNALDRRRAGTTTAKLTDAQVREVRQRLAAGEKQAHIAKNYGVVPAVIWQIRIGKTYRHVA